MSRSRRRNQNEGSLSDPNADLLDRLAQVENEKASLQKCYEMFKKLSTEQASELQKIKKENAKLKIDLSRQFDPFADLIASNEKIKIAKIEEDCEKYKKLYAEQEEQLRESKEKQAKLEDETAKILRRHSELRKTALREFKFVRGELTKAKAENDVLRLQNRSHGEQMKINHSIYLKKYNYQKQVNETAAEKENKLRLQREAEERRFSSDKHGIVTKWTDRQYFRVFYGKDHAETQTESPKMRSKGVATTDTSWENMHSEFTQLRIAKAKEFYNEARINADVNALHQVFTSEKSTQVRLSSSEEQLQNTTYIAPIVKDKLSQDCPATAVKKLFRIAAECNLLSVSRCGAKSPAIKDVESELILEVADKALSKLNPDKIEVRKPHETSRKVLPPKILKTNDQLTSSRSSSPNKTNISQKSISKQSSSPLRLTNQAKQNAKKFLGLQGRTKKNRVETLPAFDPETFEFSEYQIHIEDSNSASVSCSAFDSSDLAYGETCDESRELTNSALEEEVVIQLIGEKRRRSSDKSENHNEDMSLEQSLEDGEIDDCSLDDPVVDTEKEAGDLESSAESADEQTEVITEITAETLHPKSSGDQSYSKLSEYPPAGEISGESAATNETSIDEATNSIQNTSQFDSNEDTKNEANHQDIGSTLMPREQISSRDSLDKRSSSPVNSNDTLSSIDSIDSQTYPDREMSVLEEKTEVSLNSNVPLSIVVPEPPSLSGSSKSTTSREIEVDKTVSMDRTCDSFASSKSPHRGRSPIVIDCRTAPIPDDCLELTNDTQSCYSTNSKETISKHIAEHNESIVPSVATTPDSGKNAYNYTTPDNSIDKAKPVGSAKRKSTTPIKINVAELPSVKRKRASEKRKRRSKSRPAHESTKKVRKTSTETDEDTSKPKRPLRVSPKPSKKTKTEVLPPEAENTPPKKLFGRNANKRFDLSSNSNSPLFVPKSSNLEKRRVPLTTLSKAAISEEKLTSEDDGVSYMRSDQLFQNTASRKPSEKRNCQLTVGGP